MCMVFKNIYKAGVSLKQQTQQLVTEILLHRLTAAAVQT